MKNAFPPAWRPPAVPCASSRRDVILMPGDIEDDALSDRIAARNAAGFVLPAMPNPSIKLIVTIVARHFSIPEKDLLSRSLFRQHVSARQRACYLIRELTQRSYPSIGRVMGGWDHTTMLHSCRAVFARGLADEAYRSETAEIIEKVRHALYESLPPQLAAPLVADMAGNIREAA